MGDKVNDLPAEVSWLPLPWPGLSCRSLMSFISFRVSVMGRGADDVRSEKGDGSSSPMFGRVESLSLDDGLDVADSVYRFVLRGFCFLRVISNVSPPQRSRSPFFFHWRLWPA